MNELPFELVIEIFSKISLSDFKTFNTVSKVNKKFNFVYKKYFEDRVKKYFEDKKIIPLNFWFNRNPGLSLPIIALQYHPVQINIELINYNQNETNVIQNKEKKRNKIKTKKKNTYIKTKKKNTYIKGKKNIPRSNKFYDLQR